MRQSSASVRMRGLLESALQQIAALGSLSGGSKGYPSWRILHRRQRSLYGHEGWISFLEPLRKQQYQGRLSHFEGLPRAEMHDNKAYQEGRGDP